MSIDLKDLWIRPCTSMGDVREFIEKYHYSHSVKGITPFLSFEVVLKNAPGTQVGAAIFGVSGQIQTERKYGVYLGSKRHYRPGVVSVELRRFVLLDEVPRNAESFLLGRLLQKLATLGVERIISYADPNQVRADDNGPLRHPDGKHTGLIYHASGFHMVKEAGKTKAVIMQRDFTQDGKTFKAGRRLPIRNLDQYQNFRVRTESDLPVEILAEWRAAFDPDPKKSRAVEWTETATGRKVYVIKTPERRTSLSKRLRAAIACGVAKIEPEDGKILHIKDLFPDMEHYEIANGDGHEPDRPSGKGLDKPSLLHKKSVGIPTPEHP